MKNRSDLFFTIDKQLEIKEQINFDLSKIVSFITLRFPKVHVGLHGSFSYSEGRVLYLKNKLIYVSDFDMVVITNSLFDYLRLISDFEIKNLSKTLGFDVSFTFSSVFLIKTKLFVPVIIQLLYGKKNILHLINKKQNFKNIHLSYLFSSCYFYWKISNESNSSKELISRCLISVLRAFILSKQSGNNFGSLKYNLEFLNKNKNLFSDYQYKLFSETISYLSGSKNNAFFKKLNIELMNSLLLPLLRKLDNITFLAKLKFQFRYYAYFFSKHKTPNLFISSLETFVKINYLLLNKSEKHIQQAKKLMLKMRLCKEEDFIEKEVFLVLKDKLLEINFFK